MTGTMVQKALDEVISEMGLLPLREKQTEAVLSIVAGKDTFVTLPTGYGKSIIYGRSFAAPFRQAKT